MMVRPATLGDIDRLVLIDDQSFQDISLGRESWEMHVEKGACFVYGDPVKGFLLLHEEDDLLSISRLGVDERFRRRGIGTALVDFGLARSHRTARLMVETSNLRAISLYRKMGFDIIGEFQSEGQSGHYIMWREVA